MTEDEEFEALEQRLNMKETKQPEALRLADWLDGDDIGVQDGLRKMSDCAAELRRLHALNQELLEALTSVTLVCDNVHHGKKDRHGFAERCPVIERIRAAIAKAQGASNE